MVGILIGICSFLFAAGVSEMVYVCLHWNDPLEPNDNNDWWDWE